MDSAPTARSLLVEHLPLIVDALDQLGIMDVLKRRLPKHALAHVSDADCIAALILNILSGRCALYRIEHVLKRFDLALLIGEHAQPNHFNDTRLARALDDLDQAGIDDIFAEIVTGYLRKPDQPTDFAVHIDSTSLSLYGIYDQQHSPTPTYGYSKDKRPDLKQLVFGLGVRGCDAMPLAYTLQDGNTSDHTVNRALLASVQQRVADDCDITLVADCKAAEAITIGQIRDANFHVITLLPDNFSLRRTLIEAAWEAEPDQENWPILAQKPGRRKADPKLYYRGWSIKSPFTVQRQVAGEAVVEAETFRFLVIASDTLAKNVEKTLPKKLKSEQTKLEKGLKTLNRSGFACSTDAQAAGEKLGKTTRLHDVVVATYFEDAPIKRSVRGRPPKGATSALKRVWKVSLEVSESEKKITAMRRRKSCFVLLSDHLDESSWPDVRILSTYRHQTLVENHTGFRWLKSQAGVSPLFLKTAPRIRSLGMVFVLALMVRNYLQHRLRSRLVERKETIPHPFTKQEVNNLTTEMMFSHFEFIHTTLLSTGEGAEQRLDIQLPPIALRILQILEVPLDRFRHPPRSSLEIEK